MSYLVLRYHFPLKICSGSRRSVPIIKLNIMCIVSTPSCLRHGHVSNGILSLFTSLLYHTIPSQSCPYPCITRANFSNCICHPDVIPLKCVANLISRASITGYALAITLCPFLSHIQLCFCGFDLGNYSHMPLTTVVSEEPSHLYY